jgi:hypothetical protein
MSDKLYDDKKNFIEENLENFEGHLSVDKLLRLNEWFEQDSNDTETRDTKEEIKLLLYNKRHMAIKRKNEMENKNIHKKQHKIM